jgi:hypothetical protein
MGLLIIGWVRDMNWLIAVTVIFVLLIAGCGIWMNAASNTVDKTIDYTTRVVCYDSGFGDGASDALKSAPYNDSRCVDLYSEGYDDGQDGTYDPPRE